VGICLNQGLIGSVHVPIAEYFGDMLRKQPDERKQNITLYHLLTMSAGFDWPEFGDWKFFSPMEYSKDMIRFILERELAADPGTKMNYNSGCSHLLSAIVQKVSGMRTEDFARKYLFGPLGIEEFHWHAKQNVNLGANGLKMSPQDMLMFGYLYLRE
jgi:CubicO group peptidase (beta-lactamase class C family)